MTAKKICNIPCGISEHLVPVAENCFSFKIILTRWNLIIHYQINKRCEGRMEKVKTPEAEFMNVQFR
jgi:hypothetical protein